MKRSSHSYSLRSRTSLGLALASIAAAACGGSAEVPAGGGGGGGSPSASSTDPTSTSTPPRTTSPQSTASPAQCIVQDCSSNLDCATCSEGRNTCSTGHLCVNCVEDAQCGTGLVCSPAGTCVVKTATCPMVGGVPSVTCSTNADCAACDATHQVCDTTWQRCVPCTSAYSSGCQATEQCVNDVCVPLCPSTCVTDSDCASCGAAGDAAHACNAGTCAQCSPTYPCPSGTSCSQPNGACVVQCGQNGVGTCSINNGNKDCANCGGGATQCHADIGSTTGTCGPAAAGCSVLGTGIVLPAPWNEVTNTCSNDADCSSVKITLNVGTLTGMSALDWLSYGYPMSACASYTIAGQTCGVCVPCHTDADCQPIEAVLISIPMTCANIAGDYGICSPSL